MEETQTEWIISRYNHKLSWINDYTDKYTLYDRSEVPLPNAIVVPNKGSDILDKLDWIITRYNDLPDIAILLKCNIFDYIKPREFEKIKDNTTFTPILSQDHSVDGIINYYKDNLYYEINNYWYLGSHPARYDNEIIKFFKMDNRRYNGFAPGSNYIIPRENILKHSKQTYQTLKSYLEWDIYPGDAQLLERNLYYLWK